MPAVLTVVPASGPSRRFVLREGESRRVGRDPASEIFLEDVCISARHAELRWDGAGWSLRDGGSKNGTLVNGLPAAGQPLVPGDWIAFGGLLTHFERVSDEELGRQEADRARRWSSSVELHRELQAAADPPALLRRLMESVLSLTGAERGFILLVEEDGALHAEMAMGYVPADRQAARFSGSLGAVARVLETGRALVTANASEDVMLGRRASVLDLGLAALACAPLKAGERLMGVLYVDGRKVGGPFTDLDLEILEAVAEHAAILLSGLHLDRRLRELLRIPADAAVLDALEERLADVAISRADGPGENAGA